MIPSCRPRARDACCRSGRIASPRRSTRSRRASEHQSIAGPSSGRRNVRVADLHVRIESQNYRIDSVRAHVRTYRRYFGRMPPTRMTLRRCRETVAMQICGWFAAGRQPRRRRESHLASRWCRLHSIFDRPAQVRSHGHVTTRKGGAASDDDDIEYCSRFPA